MRKLIVSVFAVLVLMPSAKAEIGINAGIGVPFVSQYGVDLTMGPSWTISASYNILSLESDTASISLSMPQVLLNWHPFAGAFYIGVGVGKETLEVEATDELSGASARAEVNANTALARVGWMWGKANGSFWFGMDATYVSPSGGDVDVETVGFTATDEEYQDVLKAGEDFGNTAYLNITFARFGWLF